MFTNFVSALFSAKNIFCNFFAGGTKICSLTRILEYFIPTLSTFAPTL